MSGKITTKNLEVGENITMSGSGKFDMSGSVLDVSGVTIRNDLEVKGDITMSGSGKFDMSGSVLDVSGVTIRNDLEVKGDITMSGSGKKFDMSGCDLDVSGVTIRKDLEVKRNITMSGSGNKFDMSGSVLDVSDVTIRKDLEVQGTSTFENDVTMNKKLDVSGVDISKNLKVGGNITMSGSGKKFDMSGSVLDVSGVTIRNDLTVKGNITGITSKITANENAITAIEVKTDNISITQAVDLDIMKSNIATNNDKVTYPSADATKVGKITINDNLNLSTMSSNITTNISDIRAIEVKTNNITCTQEVDLDTMANNIATNNSKVTYPDADATKVGRITINENLNLSTMASHITTNTNAITANSGNTGVADKVAISEYNYNLWCYLTFANSYSGDKQIYADTNLIFNPHSNTLSTTKFAGNLSGIADSANCIKIQQVNTSSMGYLTFAVITSGYRFIYCDSDLKYDSVKNILTVKAIDITGYATNSTTAAWRANSQEIRVTYLYQGGLGANSYWGSGLAGHYFRDISLRVQNTIAGRYLLLSDTIISKSAETYSDARIKMNIEDVPDTLALEQVRQLPCRYYEYKDKFKRGHGKTIGFIAQEVKEVLPMAVTTMTKFIPDHLRMAEVSWEEVDGKYLMTVSNLDTDVVSGTEIRFELNTGTPAELNEDGSVKTLASDDFSNCEKEVVMREGREVRNG